MLPHGEHGQSGLRYLVIVPVMRDPRVRLYRRVIDDLARQFGGFRILRGMRADIRLAEAFEAGAAIIHYAPRSRGAMDYQLLKEELEALWYSFCTQGPACHLRTGQPTACSLPPPWSPMAP